LEAISQFANFNDMSEQDYFAQNNKFDQKKYVGKKKLKVPE
jgi:hypothetical protein